MSNLDLYDKYYYMTSCGIPYNQKEKWDAFFGNIADIIIREINPKTVLDAGCAYGYLVEALRKRGVEAYGIDISEYAISQVSDEIKPYCSVASVLSPLPGKYDLIICIEVLEHLEAEESRKATENLCLFSDDILFTSTPTDFKESTHYNVQPTEYWAKLFAHNNFYRDFNFDASFIINHAIRFKKSQTPFFIIASEYERVYYKTFLENKSLREELVDMKSKLSKKFEESESDALKEKNRIIADKDKWIIDQTMINNENTTRLEQLILENEQKKQLLNKIENFISNLDSEHLKQIQSERETINLIMAEKEKNNVLLQDQLNEVNKHVTELMLLLHEKENDNNEVVAKWQRLALEMETQMNEAMANYDELSEINLTLKKRIADISEEKNTTPQLISNLQLELHTHQLTARHLEQELSNVSMEMARIKNLKAVKMLWKYYKIRDNALGRKPTSFIQKTSTLTASDNQPNAIVNQKEILTIAQEESIHTLEKQYFSANPIYHIGLEYSPLISIIIPVFNTPINVLEETLSSTLSQTYKNLEIVIVNASPQNEELSSFLYNISKEHNKITLIDTENKGISTNTNIGISASKGEFIAFVDHDDIITPHALFEIVSMLQENPNAYDFFYSDKDMMTENGVSLCNPLYKPTWSPEIMYSANYLTHFCVVRKKLIEQAGMLDSSTDGAQDWDIYLKISNLTTKILRIPAKLYHWRILQTSVASGIGAKPYALEAQLRSIRKHLSDNNFTAEINFKDRDNSILKIDWNGTVIKKITLIIYSTGNYKGNYTKLALLLKQYSLQERQEIEVIFLCKEGTDPSPLSPTLILPIDNAPWTHFDKAFQEAEGEIIIVMDAQTQIKDVNTIKELVQWAAQPSYGTITPKLITQEKKISSIGIAINGHSVLDMFAGVNEFDYTLIGHTEWYRNVSAVRPECFAIKSSLAKKYRIQNSYNEFIIIDLSLRLLKDGFRNVYVPFAIAETGQLVDFNKNSGSVIFNQLILAHNLQDCDPYWNPNLKPNDGVPTENKQKIKALHKKTTPAQTVHSGWEKYSIDAQYLSHAFDFSLVDLEANNTIQAINKGELNISTINWFLPQFDFIYYAGLYTIFRFANYLATTHQIKNTFIIVGHVSAEEMSSMITEAFPALRNSSVRVVSSTDNSSKLPYADASICSLWTTAYHLLKFNNTKRKFYFIQDFEPLFYPAGSTYGQAEATYKFNFYGITNTEGLMRIYEKEYGGKAVALKPCVDRSIFYPDSSKKNSDKFRVFFYGRPGHPRNGFELGTSALRILKGKLGEKLEIYCAGSEWNPADYGLENIITNIGRMDFEKTADLYRICHVGLIMMFTKHPSYLPFELMATGCAVVSNQNEATAWFLKSLDNCLLSESTATRIAESIETLLLNETLRNKITTNALNDITNSYTNWDAELNKIFQFMKAPKNSKV